jgi:hypothetical protein
MSLNVKEINIYSGSYATGSDGQITGSLIAAVWEVDPEDGKSLQLRIKGGSLSGFAEDRIPFYISASGQIGIGTKNPTDEIEIASTNNRFKANLLSSVTCSTTNVIAYGNVSASSFSGPINGGTF